MSGKHPHRSCWSVRPLHPQGGPGPPPAQPSCLPHRGLPVSQPRVLTHPGTRVSESYKAPASKPPYFPTTPSPAPDSWRCQVQFTHQDSTGTLLLQGTLPAWGPHTCRPAWALGGASGVSLQPWLCAKHVGARLLNLPPSLPPAVPSAPGSVDAALDPEGRGDGCGYLPRREGSQNRPPTRGC